jgi:hypothetical protein
VAIMLAKTYAALGAAGAPEEEAQAAAEELAGYEARFASVDNDLVKIDSRLAAIEDRLKRFSANVNVRFTMLIWAIGINATATMRFSAFC